MKYNAPPGDDLNAPFIDGNRSAGIKGSVVPAAAIETPQRELVHLIGYAGMTPDNADLEQVRKAIEALIAAATGGGDTSQFLLVSQARARLPIFPEVLSADGKINVISPAAGSVQVPSGVSFQHRGIFPVSTGDYIEADRTFATVGSKTYHLRWTPTGGFALKDLADAVYNPGVLAESSIAFDSTYDDMLISRVVTTSGNVPTITNLVNLDRLYVDKMIAGIKDPASTGELGQNTVSFLVDDVYNWARTPKIKSLTAGKYELSPANEPDVNMGVPTVVNATPATIPLDRYKLTTGVMVDFATSIVMHFMAHA